MPNTGRIKNLEFLAKALFSSVIPAFKPKASRNPGGSGKNTFLDCGSWAAMTIKTFVFVMVFIVSTIFYIPNSAHASTINIPPNFLKLSSDLVGWWTFDGKDMLNGKALDKSGNNNTGTLVNIATSTFYKAGKIGQAFNFDGVNDYVNAESASILDNLATMAISLWVYRYQNSGDLISKDRNNPYGWRLFSAGTNSLSFSVSYSTTALTRTAANNTFPLNKWTHVVLVWNGATSTDTTAIKMYKDGIEVNYTGNTTGGIGNRMDDNTAEVYLGVRCPTCGSPLYAKSILDDVRIYNRVLSAGEVVELYNIGAAGKINTSPVQFEKSGLVGYWTFDGKDMLNGKALDKSGNGNTGTLVNIATSTFYALGKIGQAFNFDGVNDYGLSSTLDLSGTNKISVAMWLLWPAYANNDDLAFEYPNNINNAAGGFFFDPNGAAGYINVAIKNNLGYNYAYYTRPTANVWHHFVAIYDKSQTVNEVELYIDGVYQTAVSRPGTSNNTDNFPNPSTGGFYLMSRAGTTLFGAGKLDDLRVYNRVLSAGEVVELYNIGAAGKINTSPVQFEKSGLVGYWTFDGKDMLNGKALDKSGNGNTGTLVNIATSTFYALGKIGQAFNFDGVNDYVSVNSNLVGNGAATFSAWIYPTGLGGGSIGRVIDGNNAVVFRLGSTNSIAFTSDNITTAVSANNVFVLNRWSHILVTRNSSGTANIYVNGVLSGTANQNSGTPASVSPYLIGSNSALSRAFQGKIDDVRIYNRALSAGEVRQLYNMGR